MKNFRTYLPLFLIVCFLMLAQPELSAQCAMCKQAAESSMKSNPNSMARSLNSGILYLMAVPYLLILFIFRKQVVQLVKKFYTRHSGIGKTPSKLTGNS